MLDLSKLFATKRDEGPKESPREMAERITEGDPDVALATLEGLVLSAAFDESHHRRNVHPIPPGLLEELVRIARPVRANAHDPRIEALFDAPPKK